MKHSTWIFLAGALWLAACGPASTPFPSSTPPPTVEPSPVPIPATATPTLLPVALAGPQAGTSMAWFDGSLLVYVPGGEFSMGLGYGDAPLKTVSLDGYWIYTTEVTNKMYAQCVASGNCAPPAQELGTPLYTHPDYGDYPVVGVTWDMANNYCQWIQAELPTEAQWEKAARGPSGNDYPWGNDRPGCDLLNQKGCLGHTSGVNDYPAGRSPYGVLDMAGNVFEWVRDFYSPSAYDSMPLQNPAGPAAGTERVIRGSSFESEASQALSALRHYAPPSYHSRDLGFRCVINQPKRIAPYCQTASYVPNGMLASGAASCQSPEAKVRGNYCSAGQGYTTVQIPDGATYELNTRKYTCSEAVVDGKRILTCSGPADSSGEVTVCNPACSNQPGLREAVPSCDPAYTRDASSGACVYTPILGQPGVAGCPPGYNLIDRGGKKVCALGLSQNGQCPMGLYFDTAYGACVHPSGLVEAPYGLDQPQLALQTYQACVPGYTYDQNYQCCQANVGGTYPGCPLGFVFDASQNACVPTQVRASVPGCVTVQLNIARCGPPIDICSAITTEPVCIRNGYACQWNEQKGICEKKKKK